MKNLRMLMLFFTTVATVAINATNFEPYFAGLLVNDKDQTLWHQKAKKCHKLNEIYDEVLLKANEADRNGKIISFDKDKLDDTVLMRDKYNKTARDYAKEIFKITECLDCAKMAFKLKKLEKKAKAKAKERLAAQIPVILEDKTALENSEQKEQQ